MREIKFRVWDKVSDRFFSEEILNKLPVDVFLSSENIQQFTGLKDKNGKEIYEGDILRDGNGFLYEVFWLDISASFELAEKQELPDDYDIPTFNFRNSFKLEVVNNIFENPNLIKT